MHLTQQQVNFFRHSGYLKLPFQLPDEQTQELRKAVLLEFQFPAKPFITNAAGRVMKLYDLYGRGEPYQSLIKSGILLDPLESLLGPNILFTRYRHNQAAINLPNDNPVRLHRDTLQWSRTLITVVVYLDGSTENTGCTQIIPGSHLFPLVGTPNNGGTWMDEHSVYKDLIEQAIPVPVPSGGILLFDGLVFHTVGPNLSEQTRAGIVLGYHSVDELEKNSSEDKILVRGEQLYKGNDLGF